VARCSDCESDDREGGHFCEACGRRIEPGSSKGGLLFARLETEDEGSTGRWGEDEPEPMGSEDTGPAASSPEPEGEEPAESKASEAGDADSTGEDEGGLGSMEPEDEGASDTDPPAEDEGESGADSMPEDAPEIEPPKSGYLVFPDFTEQPIPESQWLIGRADLTKFLRDPKMANEISRGHLTVFQDGEKFFIEDGKTMVQEKASSNKTWVVRGGTRILVTGTGRNELQDADEIDVAELVTIQFVMK